MLDKYNSIVFDPEDYESLDKFNKDVITIVDILLKNNYVCVVRREDFGITAVDFNYDASKEFGNAVPMWLEPEEVDMVMYNRENNEEDECECNKDENSGDYYIEKESDDEYGR